MIVRYAVLDVEAQAARRLAATNDPDHGVIVVQVRPDLRRPGNLAEDLLQALGCRGDVTAASTPATETRRLVRLWLRAHDVHTVVLVEGGQLRRPVLRPIIDDLAQVGVDLWLVDRLPREPEHEDFLREMGAVRGSVDDLPTATGPTAHSLEDGGDLPVVPDDAFPTFRWACRQVLSDTDFAVVDDTYVSTYVSVHHVLATAPREEAAAVVRGATLDALCRARGPNDTTVIVRAVEAACFVHGHLVRIDPVRLRRTATQRCLLSDEDAWRQLRAYRQPERGVACLLAALGLTTIEISEFTVGAVAANGNLVVVKGQPTGVPHTAGALLRAALLRRLDEGARADTPLLLHGDAPAGRHKLSRWLNDAACDLGLTLPVSTGSPGQGSARRLGLSLQEVA